MRIKVHALYIHDIKDCALKETIPHSLEVPVKVVSKWMIRRSLQCRRFCTGACNVFVLELTIVNSLPYWLGKSGWEGVGKDGGEGVGKKWTKIFPSPSPYFSFQPIAHSLGRIFVSPQASSEFESKMALAWSKCTRSPKYACIAG